MGAGHTEDSINLKSLRCFWVAANHGSLSRAAIELGMSESAVSQRIKKLESDLGVKLYEARGGQFRLSAAGRRALELLPRLFAQVEDFGQEVTEEEGCGTVTLVAHDPVLGVLLPKIIVQYKNKFPQSRLRLLHRLPWDSIEMVRKGNADLGVVPRRSMPRNVIFHPWRSFRAVILLPREFPGLFKQPLSVDDIIKMPTLTDYPLVVPEADDLEHNRVIKTLERRGLFFDNVLEVGTSQTVKRFVAQGLGIAVVSGVIALERDEHIRTIELPEGIETDTTYGVIYRADRHFGSLLKGLLGELGIKLDVDEQVAT